MKRVLFFVMSVLFASAMYAINRTQIVISYDGGFYNGYSYEQIQSVEEDFIKDKPRYERRFLDDFLKYSGMIAYFPTEINENDSVLSIKILQVTSKGNVTAEVAYKGQTTTLFGKGGVFGTFLNLFGDGMKSLGEAAAKWIIKID